MNKVKESGCGGAEKDCDTCIHYTHCHVNWFNSDRLEINPDKGYMRTACLMQESALWMGCGKTKEEDK